MSMTKKHYEAIAASLNKVAKAHNADLDVDTNRVFGACVQALVGVMKLDSPTFRSEQFYDAVWEGVFPNPQTDIILGPVALRNTDGRLKPAAAGRMTSAEFTSVRDCGE